MKSDSNFASGAKGLQFESERAYHPPSENQSLTEKRVQSWSDLTDCCGSILDDSDQQLTSNAAVEQTVGPAMYPDWLSVATQFMFGRELFIEARDQRDGTRLWVAMRYGGTLNEDGEWEYEPIPSSRDEDYKQRTRLTTKELAYDRLVRFCPEARS
jgi:hypothetical protein